MSVELVALLIGGLLLVLVLALYIRLLRAWSKRDTSADGRSYENNRHWYGFFYYNPDDPDAVVPRRYGIGWTVNFGHPMGKLFGIGILLLILLPIILALLSILFPGSFNLAGCHTLGCTPS